MSLFTQQEKGTPKNKSDVFGQNLTEWQHWFRSITTFTRDLFRNSDLVNFVRTFFPHPPRIDETKAGTAVSITNKLGQKVVNVVVADKEIVISESAFQTHPRRIDDIKSSGNVSLTRKLGTVTLGFSVDNDQNILANRIFGA
jgi:hypothetical protein